MCNCEYDIKELINERIDKALKEIELKRLEAWRDYLINKKDTIEDEIARVDNEISKIL